MQSAIGSAYSAFARGANTSMDQPPSNPKEPRGPVSLRIKFRSASLDQFIERYAVDVSRGGIFIRTREPLAVGTQLRFDFQLQDAAPLLAGEGTVVWIRENDPARAGVTPGMGVRFDKLTPTSQPVLEKILAEKVRREQSGAPAKTGPAGGMAVRRPSSTFSALDPAAARAAAAASGPPRVGGLSPLGAGTQPRPTVPPAGAPLLGAQPRSNAPATGSGPLGAQPRTTATATGSATSDVFGAQPRTTAAATGSGPLSARARTAETAVPGGIPTLESSGAFGRPRTTTGMNAQRPAPAPSSLFEKPTADDIDRALSVLTEVEGPAPTPVAVPVDFSSRTRRPTDAQPIVVEATPDVGDAPKASHRRPTDAQPVVLESAPDVGDAPSRRSGTRPLFSGTSELKVPTIPVATLGENAEVKEQKEQEEEDDATSAWVGSGPTRVGSSPEEAELLEEVLAQAPPQSPTAPPKPPAPPLSLDAPPPAAAVKTDVAPPKLMAPNFAPPAQKKGSGAAIAMLGVLVVVGGGAAFYFVGPGRAMLAPKVAAPVASAAPEATAPAVVPAPTPPVNAGSAADAGVAAAPTEPEKPADKVVGIGSGATPSTLRAHAEGEAPAPEAKPTEAKPDQAKPSEASPSEKAAEAKPEHGAHHAKHRGGGGSAEAAPAAAEAAPAVADVSAPAAAAGEKTAAPTGDAAGKDKAASGGGHVKVTSSPPGAEVIIDGNSVGTTPYSGADVDPALPHSITVKKDGFEAYEHMIGGSDWPRAKNGVRLLKLNAKLRSTGGGDEAAKPAATDTPAEPPPGLGTTPASPKRE